MNNQELVKNIKDGVLAVLKWMVVTVLAFAYWFAMLMIGSLVLMNVWRTSWEEIVKYSLILCAVTSIIYVIRNLIKKLK